MQMYGVEFEIWHVLGIITETLTVMAAMCQKMGYGTLFLVTGRVVFFHGVKNSRRMRLEVVKSRL